MNTLGSLTRFGFQVCAPKMHKKIEKNTAAISMAVSAFESYFIGQYGPQRWAKILAGLSPSRTAAVGVLLNSGDFELVERTPGVELLDSDWPPGPHHENIKLIIPSAVANHDENKEVYLPPPPQTSTGTLAWYWMDVASLIPPFMLDVRPGHDVLDACAAPGGKSCLLGRLLFKDDSAPLEGSLTCNEPNAKRRQKLRSVLASYFQSSCIDSPRFMVTGRPAEKKFEWRRGTTRLFDRILIDAPCTHERHVLSQSTTGVQGIQKDSWSISRCKRMAALQSRMIVAGMKCLKENGRLVYSTCSLDTERQNDSVIDKVCAKLPDIQVVSHDEDVTRLASYIPVRNQQQSSSSSSSVAMGHLTPTRHGWMAMPDEQLGWGPMYMSVLQKA